MSAKSQATAEKKNKRDNGEGSIVKRNDGRWVAKIQIGTKADGKAIIKSFYGKTSAEAKRKLKEYKNERIKNNGIETSKDSVSCYIDNWLCNAKIHQVKRSSFDKIKWIMENIVEPHIGFIQLGEISPSDIQNMINKLQKKGYSSSIVRQSFYYLKECFSLGVTRREIIYNPAIGVILPKKSSKRNDELKILSDEEVTMVIEESKKKCKNGNDAYKLGAAVELLLNTGMRVGELCALEWKDVDFENERIFIMQNLSCVSTETTDSNNKQELIITETKTKNSQRCIPLNIKAIDALKALHMRTGNKNFVIYNTTTNAHMSPKSVSLFYGKMLERCGLEKRGVHSLRHTFASKLIRSGVDIKTVSLLLGHADIIITYNTYVHIIGEQKVDAVKMIDF